MLESTMYVAFSSAAVSMVLEVMVEYRLPLLNHGCSQLTSSCVCCH